MPENAAMLVTPGNPGLPGMMLDSDTLVVALMVADGVPDDALSLAAATLREFGITTVTVPPFHGAGASDDVARLAAAHGWRAVIVASADAKLPGEIARAVALPVIRVPVGSDSRQGLALLLSGDGDLPAPAGDDAPFATVAIGPAGAKNAALFVVSLLALDDDRLRAAWKTFRAAQTDAVLQQPPLAPG